MLKIKNHFLKYYKAYGIVFFLLLLFLFSFFIPKNTKIKTEEKEQITFIKEDSKENDFITVDIKGAVINPGVYSLKESSRIEDALKKCGGLREDADTNYINLSKKVKDEMVIIIYTKEEINQMVEGNVTIKYIDKECICPTKKNDACINENKLTNKKDTENQENLIININTASLEELQTLTGIGEAKAKAIAEYRKQTPFTKIEDIQNVKGIGEAIFVKIKDFITV